MSEAPFEIVQSADDRATWLEARRSGIGGSDAPALFGLVGWASPSSVQADKWGLLDEPDDAEILRWGRRLQGPIMDGLAEEMGIEIRVFEELIRSKSNPFMLCTPDAVTADGDFVQIKNTMKADDWQEGIPAYVWVQCQHELAVTGRDRMIAAALVFGNRLRWMWVERDAAFISEELIPAEREFWALTEAHEPCPADGSESTRRVLQALYPEDSGETVSLDGHFLDLDAERAALEDQSKEVDERLREIDNEIRAELKDATFGVMPNGVRFSLKTQTRKEHTVKASTFRVLRRLKGAA